MASSAAALSSANSCTTNMRIQFFNNNRYNNKKQNLNFFKVRASSSNEDEDCNVEECAPDKEVGKVSMEWLAGEKTKVAGTFPPRKRDWSGYVEKDTAGQTNIYSVEPAVYVAESAISSGTPGASAEGAENTAALFAFGGLIAVAAASVVLFQVGKNPPQVQTLDYSGPSLSYYISKFKPTEIVEVSAPIETETSEQPESSTQQVDPEVSETETPTSAEQPESSTLQVVSETATSVTNEQPESSTLQVVSETATSLTAPQESESQRERKVQVRSTEKMRSREVISTTHPVNKGGFDRLRWTRPRRIDAIHGKVESIKGRDPIDCVLQYAQKPFPDAVCRLLIFFSRLLVAVRVHESYHIPIIPVNKTNSRKLMNCNQSNQYLATIGNGQIGKSLTGVPRKETLHLLEQWKLGIIAFFWDRQEYVNTRTFTIYCEIAKDIAVFLHLVSTEDTLQNRLKNLGSSSNNLLKNVLH
ncbi:hypothetical protein OSB04_013173 [Centaurea solstitialis]|uniref:Uncharacterized protein n=1 Tax=Centaurea solstitialis TaxID=347529 RepID=A0AA38WQG5_9ASTR|nr:hypothetical protein OSB04_013173 [Centaurea solstitialis]